MIELETFGPYVVLNEREWIDKEKAIWILDKLRKESNIEEVLGHVPDKPKILGVGTQGTAVEFLGGQVLKITEDKSEAQSAAVLMKANMRGIYRVDLVASVPKKMFTREIFLILQEKLKDSAAAKNAGDQWAVWRDGDFSARFAQWLRDNEYYKPWNMGSGMLTNSTVWKNEGNTLLKLLPDFFKETDEKDIKKYKKQHMDIAHGMTNLGTLGIEFKDIHGGNVMERKNGEVVIIDIGYSKSAGGRMRRLKQI